MRTRATSALAATLGILFWFCTDAAAQVRSVTLGIRTHCPYGIRGCWPEIRDGLETPKSIVSICAEPDGKTDTCEVKMREDWVADPDMFQRNFLDMHIGVDVRGVEAEVDGWMEMQGTNLVLRLSDGNRLRLMPLQQKIQWDKERKQPQAATAAEQSAFFNLAAQSKKTSSLVSVIGPLRNAALGQPQRILEVRKFKVLKNVAQSKP